MEKSNDPAWNKAVFALVCDDNLNFAANALALEITRILDVEVHVFIETKPDLDYTIKELDHGKITYHHNILFRNIEAEVYDTPRFSRATWGRIMLPSVLGDFKRIIYCDIDVLPGNFDSHILDIDLPHGIALVRDESDILSKNNILTDNHAKFRIGDKYFNSGFMIIDPLNWDSKSVKSSLTDFFESGDASIAPYVDQDFLNVHFAGRITELSPLYNLQHNFMRLAAINPHRVAVRHYTGSEKPYYRTRDLASREIVAKGRNRYAKMMSNAGIDLGRVPERSKPREIVLKAKLRKKISNFGLKSRKEIKLYKKWNIEHSLFVEHLLKGAHASFSDDFNIDDILSKLEPHFDGFEYYA